jgi:hypothetical protein
VRSFENWAKSSEVNIHISVVPGSAESDACSSKVLIAAQLTAQWRTQSADINPFKSELFSKWQLLTLSKVTI